MELNFLNAFHVGFDEIVNTDLLREENVAISCKTLRDCVVKRREFGTEPHEGNISICVIIV